MTAPTLINPNLVVLLWVTMGIEDFFLSFRMSEKVGHSRYDPFINAMGLELVCKGYLLALQRSEYEGLVDTQAKIIVNKLAKGMKHKVTDLVEEIKESIGQSKVQPLLGKKYDGYTGCKILKSIEAAYLECRYPVPTLFYEGDKDFKVPGLKNAYFNPVYSSGLHKFCYEFCRLILSDLKTNFGIGILESWWDEKITGDAGRRFGNLFFDSRKEDFMS